MRIRPMLTLAAAWLLAAASAVGDEAATSADAPPCESDPSYRQFDFWLGDWNVYTPDGALAGINRITRTEGGCLIREEWRGARGGSGFSMNFRDVRAGAWRQVWVSPTVQIDYSGGLDASGAMVLNGTITYIETGASHDFRGTWTPADNGEVIQHFEQGDRAGDTWTNWFVGRYVPAAEDQNPAARALRTGGAQQHAQ